MHKYTQIGICILLLAMLGTSCSYKKKNILFKTPKKVKTQEPVKVLNPSDTTATIYRHRIKVNDRLLVRFLNNYDLGGASGQSAISGANDEASNSGPQAGYLVNYDSTVILPLIGRINLVGLTRLEASAQLEKVYSKYIVNPIIDCNIASLGVTILGEIPRPGRIYVDKENTTLVNVIAMAGGFKDVGKKKDIKIIRGKEVIIVNLKKIEALESPDIVMHDNDIVYVEPYGMKANTEALTTITPVTTLFLTALSTTLLISQMILFYSK